MTLQEPTARPSAEPAGALGFWNIAAARPQRPAVIDADGTITTFGALLERSRRISSTLRSLGVGPGDNVAVMLPNHRSFFEVLLGALESGLVVVPVNSHLAGGEVAHVLADSDAKAFITHQALGDVARGATADVNCPHRFAVGNVDGFRPYRDLLAGDAAVPLPRAAAPR